MYFSPQQPPEGVELQMRAFLNIAFLDIQLLKKLILETVLPWARGVAGGCVATTALALVFKALGLIPNIKKRKKNTILPDPTTYPTGKTEQRLR